MLKQIVNLTLVMALVLGLASIATAAPLDGSKNLNGYVFIPLAGGTQNVTVGSSNYYRFGDRLGDGSNLAVTPAGLQMGGFILSTTNGTAINLGLNGGDITGNAGVIAFDTRYDTSSGAINIRNVGDMTVGTLRTSHSSSKDGSLTGAIQIGENTTAGRAGHLIINGLETVSSRRTGTIKIYSAGDVLIKNHSTNVLGNVDTYNTGSTISGAIEIKHDGSFAAANVRSYNTGTYSSQSTAGNVDFNGNAKGDDVSGTFRVTGSILTYQDRAGSSNTGNAAHVSISNYQSVTIGNIQTYNNSTHTSHYAGNVTISGITGDISITGALNLNASSGDARDGDLTLTAGGTITLASLNMANVKNVKLTPDKYTYIGTLSNFDSATTYRKELYTNAGKKVLVNGGGTLLTQLNTVGGAAGGGWLVNTYGNMTADNTNSTSSFGASLSVKANASTGLDGVFATVNAVSGSGGSGKLDTVAAFLGANLTGERTVTMQWRTRTLAEQLLLSDVVDITGTAGDTYVLQMSYDQTLFDELSFPRGGKALTLGYYDAGTWVFAGTGSDLGAYAGQLTVGSWGVDTLTQTAWAVLDHNSQYAVLGYNIPAVSEPASLGLLGLALLGLRKRRN